MRCEPPPAFTLKSIEPNQRMILSISGHQDVFTTGIKFFGDWGNCLNETNTASSEIESPPKGCTRLFCHIRSFAFRVIRDRQFKIENLQDTDLNETRRAPCLILETICGAACQAIQLHARSWCGVVKNIGGTRKRKRVICAVNGLGNP
jgi:hypothetical protein